MAAVFKKVHSGEQMIFLIGFCSGQKITTPKTLITKGSVGYKQLSSTSFRCESQWFLLQQEKPVEGLNCSLIMFAKRRLNCNKISETKSFVIRLRKISILKKNVVLACFLLIKFQFYESLLRIKNNRENPIFRYSQGTTTRTRP